VAVSLADVHVQRHVPSERLENGCSSGALVIRSEHRLTVGLVQPAGAQAPVAGTPIREKVRRPSTLLGPEGTATLWWHPRPGPAGGARLGARRPGPPVP
jgi:hypothetical protein